METASHVIEEQLIRLATRSRRRALRRLEQFHPELDYGNYLYLMTICDADGDVRGADLAEQLGVHKSTASRAVSTLTKLGLITCRPDPHDGRARILEPSEQTLRQLSEFRTETQRRLRELFVDWDAADQRTFAEMLQRYNDAADTLFG